MVAETLADFEDLVRRDFPADRLHTLLADLGESGMSGAAPAIQWTASGFGPASVSRLGRALPGLVPAAASAPGVGTSNWKTQITVVNPTSATRTASIHFVQNGSAWPGVLLRGPEPISALRASYFDDVLGTLNLLEAARRGGVRQVLFASTGGAIYGEQERFPADEDHPTRPVSPYGAAKLAVAETYDSEGRFKAASNASYGLPQSQSINGNYVTSVAISDASGTILITYKNSGLGGSPTADGQTMILDPNPRQGSMEWACDGSGSAGDGSMPNKYRPNECRP